MKKYLKTPEEVIDVLQDGKVVTNKEGCHYKMYKGVIFCFWKNKKQWDITFTLGYSDDLYVDEPEQLKLEVGKFYKTRDGRKAIVLAYYCEEEVYPYLVARIGVWEEPYRVAKNCFRLDEKELDAWDLVAPWEE